MKYGHFDDAKKEYVITRPDTPLPWINYLGNNGFFSLISNTAGGYSFYKDAKLRRITRFRYNDVPRDNGGRCFYLCTKDSVWSPAFLPAAAELDTYQCRHGLGYTIFESEKNGIASELTVLVPVNGNCELQRLIITNKTNKPVSLQSYAVTEWCLWNAVDDSTNFQRNYNIGEVEISPSVIYHKTEYRERRNHYSFYAASEPASGYDSDLDSFLGKFRSFQNPLMVEQRSNASSVASGWSPIAALRHDFILNPGESKTLLYQIGYVEVPTDRKFESPGIINKSGAVELMDRFLNQSAFDNALSDLENYWAELLGRFQVETGDDKIDRMVNIWNQYQCMVTFNLSRSASYYESGIGRGMGFRDSCQDLLGFVHLIPEKARERIIDIASIQFRDGSTYHQYQPLTKRGNADIGGGFNDDPLWLVACTSAYIRETGDYSILDTQTPFNNEIGSEAPLMEHLRRSIKYTVDHRGPHGLPLIGRADWNDCLNLNCFSSTPGESFQTCSNFESGKAESVFIAAMFVKYAKDYADICTHIGETGEAAAVLDTVSEIEKAVINHGWDGEWFLRAYDAFERPVGSRQNTEGRIFIEPQGFCVMAGIGGKELGSKAMNSVDTYLKNDFGIEVLHPCYTQYYDYLGEISSYPPGYKENGSVFCHNNPWIVLAYTELENGNAAFDIYSRNAPSFLEDKSEIHKTEPYCYSQTIAGRDAANYGEAKNSWLTGTAAWTFVAISQGILGIRPTLDGLSIHPCLPDSLNEFSCRRRFRNNVYNIHVSRSDTQKGVFLNGVRLPSDCIPFTESSEDCTVECYI